MDSRSKYLNFSGLLACAALWIFPTWSFGEVSCQSEARFGPGGQQAGVALVCVNSDPFAQTLRLNLRASNLADALPPESMHVLRPGQRLVLRELAVTGQPWSLSFGYSALFGAVRSLADGVPYRLPLPAGSTALVAQFYGGPRSSHSDAASRYAVDFGVPYGTAVTAARSGVVAVVKDGSTEGGRDGVYQGRENLVIVYHSDDTWAVYGHLAPNSVPVRPGDVVNLGQTLGKTGKSGMLAGPHLHFAVQMRTPDGLFSLPVLFETAAAVPVTLQYGQRVTAD